MKVRLDVLVVKKGLAESREKAKAYIQKNIRKPITQQMVAEMYGYSDANYVSALYKKLFGRNITSLPEDRKSGK